MKPLENDLLDKAIIIVGTPRSGTTFLGNVLKHHPALAYLEEPRLTWRYGNDDKSAMLRPDDARDEVCAHIIRETFSEVFQAFEQEYKPGMATGRINTAEGKDIGRIRRWIEPTMCWLG